MHAPYKKPLRTFVLEGKKNVLKALRDPKNQHYLRTYDFYPDSVPGYEIRVPDNVSQFKWISEVKIRVPCPETGSEKEKWDIRRDEEGRPLYWQRTGNPFTEKEFPKTPLKDCKSVRIPRFGKGEKEWTTMPGTGIRSHLTKLGIERGLLRNLTWINRRKPFRTAELVGEYIDKYFEKFLPRLTRENWDKCVDLAVFYSKNKMINVAKKIHNSYCSEDDIVAEMKVKALEVAQFVKEEYIEDGHFFIELWGYVIYCIGTHTGELMTRFSRQPDSSVYSRVALPETDDEGNDNAHTTFTENVIAQNPDLAVTTPDETYEHHHLKNQNMRELLKEEIPHVCLDMSEEEEEFFTKLSKSLVSFSEEPEDLTVTFRYKIGEDEHLHCQFYEFFCKVKIFDGKVWLFNKTYSVKEDGSLVPERTTPQGISKRCVPSDYNTTDRGDRVGYLKMKTFLDSLGLFLWSINAPQTRMDEAMDVLKKIFLTSKYRVLGSLDEDDKNVVRVSDQEWKDNWDKHRVGYAGQW